jgi:hypothetical protein
VVALLEEIERHRDALARAGAVLADWLDDSRQFGQAWHEFSIAGGISGNDFHAFMDGRFRGRPDVRQLGHLRLIANREASSIVRRPLRRRDNGNPDPEAA